MTTRRGSGWNKVALAAAVAALTVFGLLSLVFAAPDLAAPSVGRSRLPDLASATASVAALGWASWAR